MKQKNITQHTRSAILDAANRVVLALGAEGLTLEAVALAAEVSKGGLLYHFPSKRKLIEGMIEGLISAVETSIEEERTRNGGNFLRAYIEVSAEENPEHIQVSSALIAAIASEPDLLQPLKERYRTWQDLAAAAAPSPEAGTLIRLALDGLWMADLFGFAPPAADLRQKLRAMLLAIAGGDL